MSQLKKIVHPSPAGYFDLISSIGVGLLYEHDTSVLWVYFDKYCIGYFYLFY